MSKSLELSGIGQHGHDVGTRNFSVIDAGQKATHDHCAKLAHVDEYDKRDQADATGDLGKYTKTSTGAAYDDSNAVAQENGLTSPWGGGK